MSEAWIKANARHPDNCREYEVIFVEVVEEKWAKLTAERDNLQEQVGLLCDQAMYIRMEPNKESAVVMLLSMVDEDGKFITQAKDGCWRSHPHEEMDDECRQMTVLARENSKLRVAAQKLVNDAFCRSISGHIVRDCHIAKLKAALEGGK